jgi:uncharacterized membrane protein
MSSDVPARPKNESAESEEQELVADVARVAAERVVSIFSSESWFGPLPHPDSLRAFERTCPGAADRIIRMAEKEQDHRHATSDRRLGITERGQHYGLTIGLAGLGVTAILGLWGAPWVAAVIGTVDIVGLVSLFVIGRLLPRQGKISAPSSEVPATEPSLPERSTEASGMGT